MSHEVTATIDQLPGGTQPLSGTEKLEALQAGQSVQITTGAIAALAPGGGGGGGGGVIVPPLTAHGLLVGQGINPVTVTAPGTVGQVLVSGGPSADPAFGSLPTIGVAGGGTGAVSLAAHGVIIGEGTNPIAVASPGTAGQVLTSNGASADPTMQVLPNATVAKGGTGVTSLANHGVVIGQGTSAVNVTSPGTTGQVLTSNGAGADPTFQTAGGGGTYPPSPTPDLQTFMQAAFDNFVPCDWIWGNVSINAPIVIHMNVSHNSTYFNFNGATIQPSASYPVNTAVDMITFITDIGSFGVNIAGFWLLNGTFLGVNPNGQVACRNCVILSCPQNFNGIYGFMVSGCAFIAGGRSGFQMYGSVFEGTLVGNFCRDSKFSGVEIRNPNIGNAGLTSSIKFFGGDYRTNDNGGAGGGYGIAFTAETAFLESFGFHIYGGDFINNGSAGVMAPTGVDLISGSHFENNCDDNAGETAGQIWLPGEGGAILMNIDAATITSNPGIYVLEIAGGSGAFAVMMGHVTNLDESLGTPRPLGHMLGAGVAWIDNYDDPSHYVGVGGWTFSKTSVTTSTV